MTVNTHVFVVNEQTFKYHLEYMFAGTGAADKQSLFLSDPNTSIHHSTERNLVGMIADINRIRVGDNVIFYLQASEKSQGKFYGTFKVTSDPFFDENNAHNYLNNKLGKGLSYRVLIEPDKVYPKGVTEHEYLDSLEGKTSPYEMCWSLIYRKLKGNRGCTMITDYEYSDLLNKLSKANNGQSLDSTGFTYNNTTKEIAEKDSTNEYKGKIESINILPRLLYKAKNKNAFETHIQAYLTQNIGKVDQLNSLLFDTNVDYWIGNEVSCGVGMQRIDLLLIQEINHAVHIRLIELKDELPKESILTEQIPWYLSWLSEYVIPNYKGKKVFVFPTVIAQSGKKGIAALKSPHALSCKGATIKPLEYYGFTTSESEISFEKLI